MAHPYPVHYIAKTMTPTHTCWLSAWSTQVSTVIDYHCGIKVEPFIFYFNIPWATSSYTLHHSSANNGGPAYFFLMGDTSTQIYGGLHWLTPIVNSVLMILLFPNNGTLTDCSQLYQRWGMMRILVLPWSKSARSWASRELDHTIDHNLNASVDLTLSLPIALQ